MALRASILARDPLSMLGGVKGLSETLPQTVAEEGPVPSKIPVQFEIGLDATTTEPQAMSGKTPVDIPSSSRGPALEPMFAILDQV